MIFGTESLILKLNFPHKFDRRLKNLMHVLIFTKNLATPGHARKKKFGIAGKKRKKSDFLEFLKLETEI